MTKSARVLLLLPAIAATTLGFNATAAHAAVPAPTAADLEFVQRAHVLLLSAGQASALAGSMGSNAKVKAAAKKISTQDAELEKLTTSTASGLKMTLTATGQPVSLGPLQSLSGPAFDTNYVNQLWTADGSLLPISTAIHSVTKSDAVKKLAAQTNTVIAAQLPLLEASGLVQFGGVAAQPSVAPAVNKLPGGATMDAHVMAEAETGSGFLFPNKVVSVAVLVVALGLAVIIGLRRRTRKS